MLVQVKENEAQLAGEVPKDLWAGFKTASPALLLFLGSLLSDTLYVTVSHPPQLDCQLREGRDSGLLCAAPPRPTRGPHTGGARGQPGDARLEGGS